MITVGLFFGGSSVEHEISVISALQAARYLDRSKYNILPIYITRDGEFYTGEKMLDIANYEKISALLAESTPVAIVRDGKRVVVRRTQHKLFAKDEIGQIDVAFPIVHGTNCEDGSLQGFFEILRLPYVGCDVTSSALGMDKAAMKDVFMQAGIPVVSHQTFRREDWQRGRDAVLDRLEEKIGYPMIVKPVNLGSSIGISKAENRAELEEAAELAVSFAQRVLVERAVQNLREINCAVLGDAEEAKPSLCEEPVSSDRILSFNEKYMSSGKTKGMASLSRIIPAELSDEKRTLIENLAVACFKALGCSGVCRMDFLLDEVSGEVFANEINTIPGSLSFYLWEPAGKPYAELLDDLIRLALKRERQRSQLMITYDSGVLSGAHLKGLSGAKGAKR